MASVTYTKGLHYLGAGGDASSAVFRAALLTSASTYTPDVDHAFVSDVIGGVPGGVECTVASYGRITLQNVAWTKDDTNNIVKLTCNPLAFGALESGQTIKGLLIYIQTGGNDSTPEDDPLVRYIDGYEIITLAADVSIGATTIRIDKVPFALPDNAALDFGGGATTAVNGAVAANTRAVTVDAIGAGASADATSTVKVITEFPFPLLNGAVTITLDATGILYLDP